LLDSAKELRERARFTNDPGGAKARFRRSATCPAIFALAALSDHPSAPARTSPNAWSIKSFCS